MYRLVDIPPPGGFFWSQTVGVVPSLRGPSTFRRLHTFYVRPPQKKGSPCSPRSDRRMGLIIPWSQVRVLAGPPSPIEIIILWRREQGIRVPWSIPLAGVSGSLDSGWASGSRTPLSRPVRTPLAPVPGCPSLTPLGCPAPPPASREKCAVDIEAFCSQQHAIVDIGALIGQSTCHQTHNSIHARLCP